MEHVNGWCFRGIYKGDLWEDDLHVSALLSCLLLIPVRYLICSLLTYAFATYTRSLPSVFATCIFRYPDCFQANIREAQKESFFYYYYFIYFLSFCAYLQQNILKVN